MVDIDEIRELKELGITKRKSEGPGKYEYSFKAPCKLCENAVDYCFCTETLEGAKKVIGSGKFLCETCQKDPDNMSEETRNRMDNIMQDQKAAGNIPDWDLAFEQLQEEWSYEWGEPRELDGTTYWDCECSI